MVALVWKSLHAALPETDALRRYSAEPELIARMIAENRLGRKSGAGFVRISPDRKTREVTDLVTGAYRPQKPVASDSLDAAGNDPRALIEHDGLAGRYAAAVMENTLAYVAAVAPEIADGPDAVDTAMCTGYGWSEGPFALIDRLGAGWLAGRLAARGAPVPPYLAEAAAAGGFYRVEQGARLCLLPDGSWRKVAEAPGVLTLAALRLAGQPVEDWEQASLWDLGDGVACFEIRSKMNTLNPSVLSALEAALALATRDFRALVIGSDAPAFSAGADIRQFLEAVEAGSEGFGERIDQGHRVFKAVKYAAIPVVGAAAGLALGGGCELLLHCRAIQAHAELAMGLPEARIGLVPGWGGCKEMLVRLANGHGHAHGPVAPALAAFDLIAAGRVTQSAFEARRLGFLGPDDGITMNRDRLLADAKATALALADGYAPPEAPALTLSGPSGAAALRNLLDAEGTAGRLAPHDRVVGEALIGVLTGGATADPVRPAAEDAVTALERRAFLDLLATPASLARVRHMAETGKPLRN